MFRMNCIVGALLTVVAVAQGHADEYPSRPITIVTTAAGGGNDFGARLLAEGLTRELGQSVIVENRPSGPISAQVAREAAPDGYTLYYQGSWHWLYPLMAERANYDPLTDYTPIILLTTTPSILAVHPSLPVESVEELIALAKERPGEINYGSGGVGSSFHLAAALFNSMADLDMVHIPYGGGGPVTLAVLGNEVQVVFAPGGAVFPHINANKLRALGIAAAEESPLAPGIPPIGNAVPGYESTNYNSLFAPANTPAEIVARVYAAAQKVLSHPEIRERFAASGVEVIAGSPEQLMETMQADMERMGKVIRENNIRAD